MKLHKSITVEHITRMVQRNMRDADSYLGVCINCGKARGECEPDTREYPCPKCKQNTVYGAEELLLEIAV